MKLQKQFPRLDAGAEQHRFSPQTRRRRLLRKQWVISFSLGGKLENGWKGSICIGVCQPSQFLRRCNYTEPLGSWGVSQVIADCVFSLLVLLMSDYRWSSVAVHGTCWITPSSSGCSSLPNLFFFFFFYMAFWVAADSVIDLWWLCYGLIINGAAESGNDAARMNNEISALSASLCADLHFYLPGLLMRL